MKILNKLSSIIIFSCIFTAVLSATAYADDNVFSELVANNEIMNAMPTKNTNASIYVTCKASVDMKSDSSNSSRQIRLLPAGYHLTVLGAEYGWVHVMDDEGRTGYVYSSNVTFKNGTKPENIPPVDPLEEKGKQVVNFSKQYLGTPYVWGGTSLTAGVDCSGFVYSVYQNFGVSLNRSSSSMYTTNGVNVSKANLKPGDLLFFNTGGRGVSHVGMYIGNGEYIHAATTNVKISNLYDDYSTRTYVGAKRVLI